MMNIRKALLEPFVPIEWHESFLDFITTGHCPGDAMGAMLEYMEDSNMRISIRYHRMPHPHLFFEFVCFEKDVHSSKSFFICLHSDDDIEVIRTTMKTYAWQDIYAEVKTLFYRVKKERENNV